MIVMGLRPQVEVVTFAAAEKIGKIIIGIR
jgi:hypothetical protein